MAGVQQVGDLEIAEDLHYQRRAWTIQRIGRAVMALIIAAALAGLIGTGPLSSAVAHSGPLHVAYHRFERLNAPGLLSIRVAGNVAAGNQIRIWLDRDYVDSLQVQQITPQPAQTLVGANRLIYVFDVAAGNRQTVIVFDLRFQAFGLHHGRVGLVGGPVASFRQFVYP